MRQIAPADNFGVGLELGVERLTGLVEVLVVADGLLEVCGGLPDFAEPGGLGGLGGVRGVEKLLSFSD